MPGRQVYAACLKLAASSPVTIQKNQTEIDLMPPRIRSFMPAGPLARPIQAPPRLSVVDRMGVRVLRDPYSAKAYVLFYVTKRVSGEVQDFDAIKRLKFSAT
jgi:hypothetical protein